MYIFFFFHLFICVRTYISNTQLLLIWLLDEKLEGYPNLLLSFNLHLFQVTFCGARLPAVNVSTWHSLLLTNSYNEGSVERCFHINSS